LVGFLFATFAVQSAFGLLTTEALTLCRIRVNPTSSFLNCFGGVFLAYIWGMKAILLASYYAHLSAAKELALILPIDNPRRISVEKSLNELAAKLNIQ